jgi:hypothetical protein
LPLNLERAINLADMALYTAKNQGRNRAVGITATQAGDAEALAKVEQDFDQAWTEGRVTLLQQAGPGNTGATGANPTGADEPDSAQQSLAHPTTA